MLDLAPCRKVSSRFGFFFSCCSWSCAPRFFVGMSISWVLSGFVFLVGIRLPIFRIVEYCCRCPSSGRNPQSDRCKSHILHTTHAHTAHTHTHEGFAGDNSNAHSVGLRGGTASDLLDTELAQLGLQFLQLLGEVILALSPELTSLDLGRLQIRKTPVSISRRNQKTAK